MKRYEAVLFDLDDTLIDRERAIDKLFSVLLETCYSNVEPSMKKEMRQSFKEYDHASYGNGDKTAVLEPFFADFPPINQLSRTDMQDFWNSHFPKCFSIDPNTLKIVEAIKRQAKVAIITNGSTLRQKAKIRQTNLDRLVDVVVISEEAGYRKPDKRIFELALQRLAVLPEAAVFVGDHIENDIGGSQNAKMKGIWFNPHMTLNHTEITPDAEIHSLDRLLDFVAKQIL